MLRWDFGQRLRYLDPTGERFWPMHGLNVQHFLGAAELRPANKRVLTITFGVGGAGAQTDIAYTVAHSLRDKIAKGEVNYNILAGVRPEVKTYLEAVRKDLALPQISIIYGTTMEEYFKGSPSACAPPTCSGRSPASCPSTAGWGSPIIMAPHIGSQEDYNQAWLLEIQAGFPQQDPQYTNEWLLDLVHAGRLADAAWNGFLKARKYGTYKIHEILQTGTWKGRPRYCADETGTLRDPRGCFLLGGIIHEPRAGNLPFDKRNYRLDRMRRLLAMFDDPDEAPAHHPRGRDQGQRLHLGAAGLRAARRGTQDRAVHLPPRGKRLRAHRDCRGASAARPAGAPGRRGEGAIEALPDGGIPAALRAHHVRAVTLLAFLYFREAGCEEAVVETGIGGRLDATNVVCSVASVITPLDLEHTDILGDTLEKIAFEKAGIIKPRRSRLHRAAAPRGEEGLPGRPAESAAPR